MIQNPHVQFRNLLKLFYFFRFLKDIYNIHIFLFLRKYLEKYAPDFTTDEFRSRYMLMGHLNAAGYQYIAWMFMTYINWIIEQNLPSFSDIGLVE